MGRWESTRNIKAFRGVWPGPPGRKTYTRWSQQPKQTTEGSRIDEIESQHELDVLEKRQNEKTLADKQYIDETYGIPVTQAHKNPRSTAEVIGENVKSEDVPELIALREAELTEDPIVEEKFEHTLYFQSLDEYREMIDMYSNKYNEKYKTHKVKVAEMCGFTGSYWVDLHGTIDTGDRLFETMWNEFCYNLEESNGRFNHKTRFIFRENYLEALRYPIGNKSRDLMLDLLADKYEIAHSVNANGTPIGSYGKFVKRFNICYDNAMRLGHMPSISEMEEYCDWYAKTEGFDRAHAHHIKKVKVKERRYLKKNPVEKEMLERGRAVGMVFNVSNGKPVPTDYYVHIADGTF